MHVGRRGDRGAFIAVIARRSAALGVTVAAPLARGLSRSDLAGDRRARERVDRLEELLASNADEGVALAYADAAHVRLVDAGALVEQALEVRGARAFAATDVDEDLREVTL